MRLKSTRLSLFAPEAHERVTPPRTLAEGESGMAHGIATWAAIGLAAKMLADLLYDDYRVRRAYKGASVRAPNEVGLAYVAMLATMVLVTWQIGPAPALLLAVVVRIVQIFNWHILLTANHSLLELCVATVMLRLLKEPEVLLSTVQVMAATVWMYAALQKWYHGEFIDGSYFYLASRRSGPGGIARLRWIVAAHNRDEAEADVRSQVYSRRLALVVVATEVLVPMVAIATSGTVFSVGALLLVALPVAVISKETNFLLTNAILAACFFVPLEPSLVWRVADDRLAASILIWFLVWPPVHAVLTRRFRFNTWKLGGWGMYATSYPGIQVIGPTGELLSAPATRPAIPFGMVLVCGACECQWLRDYARRGFFRWCHTSPAAGLLFSWSRRRGDRYVASRVVVWNTPDSALAAFELKDEHDAAEFTKYLASGASSLYGSSRESAATSLRSAVGVH